MQKVLDPYIVEISWKYIVEILDPYIVEILWKGNSGSLADGEIGKRARKFPFSEKEKALGSL